MYPKTRKRHGPRREDSGLQRKGPHLHRTQRAPTTVLQKLGRTARTQANDSRANKKRPPVDQDGTA